MTFAMTKPNGPIDRFHRDRRGAVALIFGLLLLPILATIALAIDFGNVMTARTKAQMAADAAALQAAGVARDLIKAGAGDDATNAAALTNAKARGEALFKAHADQSGLKNYTVDVKVTKTGQNLASDVSFTLVNTNFISKVFGQSTFNAAGSAKSAASLPNYSDVYLALDISGSMGIAASQPEMVKLFNAKGKRTDGTKQQASCVFGCHVIESGWSESFSTLASRLGIQLRIDVLREAVIDMIDTAKSDADAAAIYRMALYTMGASADASTWNLNPLKTLTGDFNGLKSAAQNIDIATPPVTAPQKQNSYINEQLNSLVSSVPKSEDGSSQAKSKKYVFIITDGARDVPSSFGSCTTPSGSGRCVNGINSTFCKAFKDKGITVGVLYTTYIPVLADPNNASSGLEYWYKKEMVDTGTTPKLQPALQACASDGWFYEASDGDGIEAAMAKMFAQTTQAPALTN